MRTIVCFGDSITWGLNPKTRARFDFAHRWPGIVQAKLGKRARIVEEALCDRTTVWDDPLHDCRNGKAALGMILESHAPIDLLIIMLGTNDLQIHYRATCEMAAMGCEALIELAQNRVCGPVGREMEVLLVAPPHFGEFAPLEQICFDGKEPEAKKFGITYEAVAKTCGCHFLDASKAASPGQPDGIHFDEEGHEQFAAAIAAKVEEIFNPL